MGDFSIVTNTAVFNETLFYEEGKYLIKSINYSSLFPASYEIEINGNISRQVPKLEGIKAIITDLFRRVDYVGPLRDQPREEYKDTGNNNSVGINGEYVAEVFFEYSAQETDYLEIEEENDTIRFLNKRDSFLNAVRYWLCEKFDLCEDIYSKKTADSYLIYVRSRTGIESTIKHVGFGVSQILPIVVEGLALPTGNTLILEQPGIHLHPKIQSQLFDFLIAIVLQGKRVLIETHSDHLITRLRRRIVDQENKVAQEVGLTFIETNSKDLLFRNIGINDFGALDYFPDNFIEKADVELKAIIKAQMKKATKKGKMNFTAAIDVSTFIWSNDDFDAQRHNYYHLIRMMPSMFEQIEKCKMELLFRQYLYHLIMAEFPYIMVNDISRDYGRLTFAFFVNTVDNWRLYSKMDVELTSTRPPIIKKYYSHQIQAEIQCQIDHIFYHEEQIHKFITYSYFYNYDTNLTISDGQKRALEIETLCYNSEEGIAKFFDDHKIKFEHNPKHNIYKAGGRISPLSCYNERLKDTTQAQQLLSSAVLLEGDYYNYDSDNSVYVVFVATGGTMFHGFDLSDEGENVPHSIKSKFNKSGRRF